MLKGYIILSQFYVKLVLPILGQNQFKTLNPLSRKTDLKF